MKELDNESDMIREEMREIIEALIEGDKEVTKTGEEELLKKIITVYGGVELTKVERIFLSLQPLFPLMEDLKEETTAQDFVTGFTKVRWVRMGKEPEDCKI